MTDDSVEQQVEAIRNAEGLAELATAFGTESIHEAYFDAKDCWTNAIRRSQIDASDPTGFPGACVVVDGHEFHVHGITHAGTDAERTFLREHVSTYLDRDAAVYCEQGIRSLYFEPYPSVCEMDDYRWAMEQCKRLDVDSHIAALPETGVDTVLEDIASVASTFREAAFSLIESGREAYGDRFAHALGDVAAGFLTDHADLAVGKSFEAFTLSRAASQNPERLTELQQYYERTFLPQPLEREWLRHHDPELEIVSHARNERMADYVVYHNETAPEVHLIVGAAHQPGIVYYLESYRDGRELPKPFELF